MSIKLSKDTIDKNDIDELCKWLKQDSIPQLSKGNITVEYEKKFAEQNGCDYSIMVNSGSSALLLAVYWLKRMSIITKELNLKIAVPALSWITDISPIVQFGMKPLLVDCNLEDLSVDLYDLERVFKTESPMAFICVSVLGIPPNMNKIIELCQKYDVILIEDFCESQGSKINDKNIGSFGLINCTSTYIGHNSSTIEGGMILTNDFEIYETLKMYRSHGWARDLSKESRLFLKEQNKINDFNELYTFYTDGFNVRSTDINAFIGLQQIKKYRFFFQKRFENFKKFNDGIKNKFHKLQIQPNSFVSNLGFPIITEKKYDLIYDLQVNEIECRPLISGNMGSQPYWVSRFGEQILPTAHLIDKFGLYIPNHPYLTDNEIDFMVETVNKCIK